MSENNLLYNSLTKDNDTSCWKAEWSTGQLGKHSTIAHLHPNWIEQGSELSSVLDELVDRLRLIVRVQVVGHRIAAQTHGHDPSQHGQVILKVVKMNISHIFFPPIKVFRLALGGFSSLEILLTGLVALQEPN